MMTPSPQQPSLPPASQPPYDPTVERLRLVRGMVVDLATIAAIVALAWNKTISSEAVVGVIALMAGAGAVHKGSGAAGVSKLATGSTAVTLVAGVIGKGSEA